MYLANYEHWPDPVTLNVATIGAQAGGQIYGGISAARAAKTEAGLYDYNVALMERRARQIETVTGFKQERVAEAGARDISAMREAAGASGVVGGGYLALAEQERQNDLTNLILGYEGQVSAAQARSEASMYRMEGTMAKQRGKSALIGGLLGAGGEMLRGFSKMDFSKKNGRKADLYAGSAGDYGRYDFASPSGGAIA